jgi:hypothetical protein
VDFLCRFLSGSHHVLAAPHRGISRAPPQAVGFGSGGDVSLRRLNE